MGVEYWTPHSVLSHANAATLEREPVQLAVDHRPDGDEEHREGPTPETRRRRRAGDTLYHRSTRGDPHMDSTHFPSQSRHLLRHRLTGNLPDHSSSTASPPAREARLHERLALLPKPVTSSAALASEEDGAVGSWIGARPTAGLRMDENEGLIFI